jgi:hypothetical protein
VLPVIAVGRSGLLVVVFVGLAAALLWVVGSCVIFWA